MDSYNFKKLLEKFKDKLIDLNDQIWEFAETRFEEFKSASEIKKILSSEGFEIKAPVANIETAFVATYGHGKPVIGLLAEYDALSNLSQVGVSLKRESIEEGGNGHGCGHNILGTAAVGAAILVKEYISANNITGTVKLFGCPAEEGGSGKTYMVRSGLFDEVDAALCWHPAGINSILSVSTLANYQVYFRFKGRASHAAASPHVGRSALDAVELMNVGTNYLREHIIQEARIHYAITNSGGTAPNVVPANAEVLYLIRAPQVFQVDEIYKRVCKIAQGAALMTETELEIKFDKGCSNVIPNKIIEEIMYRNMLKAGPPEFKESDYQFAEQIQKTLSKEERNEDTFLNLFSEEKEAAGFIKNILKKSLSTEILPYINIKKVMPGSTDVGDVSWVTPTAQLTMSCFAVSTPAHSWQNVSQGNTGIAHKGMLKTAEVLAMTVADLMKEKNILEKAKQELNEVTAGKYKNPIPDDVFPGCRN